MSIFSKDKVKTIAQRFDAVIDKVKSVNVNGEADRFLSAIQLMKNQPDASAIKPEDLCIDIVEMILENRAYIPTSYYPVFCQAEKMYEDIFIYDDETPDFEKLRLIFIEMFRERNVVDCKLYDLKLFNSFEDKEKYLVLCHAILSNPNPQPVFGIIKQYGLLIREYMLDDSSYLGNLIRVATKLCTSTTDKMPEVAKAEYENVQRMNGIYNIDPVKIAQVEQRIREAEQIIDSGVDVIKQLNAKSEQVNKLGEEFVKKVEAARKKEETLLDSKLENATEKLNQIMDEYVENQKNVVIMEKELLLKQIFADAETELGKYKAMAKAIAASTSMEIANLNRNAENVLNKVSNFVNNDSEVRKALDNAELNQALMEKINKLSMISDANIETMQKHMESTVAMMNVEQARPNNVTPAPAMATDMSMEIPPINPLLNPDIPFKDRWNIVMKAKKERMSQGEHFHEAFDDVLMAIMEDANPYLIGPSGCGKTFMIKQISRLLDMDFIDIGYINEEYEILGFQTATGAYSTPNFYRCYKYGIIAFCDELDNGNSRATVKLNSFLSNNLDSSYNFPNGECVKRHPNFRIVAAGNTEGNGADANYNTREKIEESVQQRFLPVHVDYDNTVEKNILKDFPEWFDFIVLFRKATNKWSEVNGISAQGILTTRDTNRIKRYLTNNSFSPDKIIKYEFIQTKDAEYLAFLSDEIRKNAVKANKAGNLVSLFANQVEEICKKGFRG